MTDYVRECNRVLRIVSCVNCWKGYLNYRLPVKFVFWGIFKRISAIEAEDLLDAVKYRQKIRQDRSDGENTPVIRGEKIGDQN